MVARRKSSSRDNFTTAAFIVLGGILASAITSFYLVASYDGVLSETAKKIRELETSNERTKSETTVATNKLSSEVARYKKQASEALTKLDELTARLTASESPKEALSSALQEVVETPVDTPSVDSTSVERKTVGREWHTKDGKNAISAKLLDCDTERKVARLMKLDGTVISVSFDNLSLDDVAYCVMTAQAGELGLADNDNGAAAGMEAVTETSQKTIDAAVNECAVRVLAAYDSDATTIQKNREYALARSTLLSAVKGCSLQIHFLVRDVTNASSLGRDRRKIDLSLTAPDIPLRFSNLNSPTGQTIEVLTSAQLAETINKGDVIRVIGRINDPGRKTFAALRLLYQLPDVPRNLAYGAGNSFYMATESPGENGAQVAFGYYIHHMRKLNKSEKDVYLAAQKSREVTESK